MPLMQSNTPESRILTRANFAFGIQQTDDARFAREWPRTATIIGQQDESVLNPQNTRYLMKASQRDFSTRFDAAGLHYRQRHTEMVARQRQGDTARSEEHTSELQSLMRISYAVFCLKKKIMRIYNHYHTTNKITI